jgi:hypothetical protein
MTRSRFGKWIEKGFVENFVESWPEICSLQAFFGLSLVKKTKSKLNLNQNPWGPVATDYQPHKYSWEKANKAFEVL